VCFSAGRRPQVTVRRLHRDDSLPTEDKHAERHRSLLRAAQLRALALPASMPPERRSLARRSLKDGPQLMLSAPFLFGHKGAERRPLAMSSTTDVTVVFILIGDRQRNGLPLPSDRRIAAAPEKIMSRDGDSGKSSSRN